LAIIKIDPERLEKNTANKNSNRYAYGFLNIFSYSASEVILIIFEPDESSSLLFLPSIT
jgi:hypothetical protein